MPRLERRFTRDLLGDTAGRHRLRVRFETEGNDMVSFMLQYETLIGNVWCPVVRYDTSHGEAHLDTYNLSGDQAEKHWLGVTEPPYNDLFTSKYEDLKLHWQEHFDAFLRRRGS